jgi:hypothetical protein
MHKDSALCSATYRRGIGEAKPNFSRSKNESLAVEKLLLREERHVNVVVLDGGLTGRTSALPRACRL